MNEVAGLILQPQHEVVLAGESHDVIIIDRLDIAGRARGDQVTVCGIALAAVVPERRRDLLVIGKIALGPRRADLPGKAVADLAQ